MTQATPSPRQADALLRALTRTLAAVGLLAAAFTAVNVTLFAHAHGVPWPIAILLDPMTALALAAVLLADARLASWGIRPPGWSATLRWFTGTAATVMNTWTSLWPDGHIGIPHHADIAGVVLHTIPPVLLVLLAETVAAYRHRITQLHTSHHPRPDPDSKAPPLPTPSPGSTPEAGDPRSTLLAGAPPLPATSLPVPAPTPAGPGHPAAAIEAYVQAVPTEPADDEVFTHALRLDVQHRSRTGQPMSIRQLKTALRIGHARAKHLRARLDAHHTTGAPRDHPGPCSWPPLPQEHPAPDGSPTQERHPGQPA